MDTMSDIRMRRDQYCADSVLNHREPTRVYHQGKKNRKMNESIGREVESDIWYAYLEQDKILPPQNTKRFSIMMWFLY